MSVVDGQSRDQALGPKLLTVCSIREKLQGSLIFLINGKSPDGDGKQYSKNSPKEDFPLYIFLVSY